MCHLLAESSCIYHLRKKKNISLCIEHVAFFAAITPSCSPSCGANAFCQEGVCVCNVGYLGDGYNCTGLNDRHICLSCLIFDTNYFEATNQDQY